MSTEYSSMTVDGLKEMYNYFLALTANQRHTLAKEMGIFLKYGLAEKEFVTDMSPKAQALILVHTECGGFGKDFNSAARTMLKGDGRARKNLREQLDWRKDNPGDTPPDEMPYKNLTDKSVFMLDLLWPCTLDGGGVYWGVECLRIRNMLGYSNMRPAPAQPPARLIPTREDPEERTTSTPVHAAVALATIPEANQEDILASPEETTMPTPEVAEPLEQAPASISPLWVLLAQCDTDKQLRELVLRLLRLTRADKAKMLAHLKAMTD